MEHLFFDSIDEMRNQTGSHGPNYLRNHTAERDYFSPLSIVTSIQKPQEYLFPTIWMHGPFAFTPRTNTNSFMRPTCTSIIFLS